jgi:hypothetical protein
VRPCRTVRAGPPACSPRSPRLVILSEREGSGGGAAPTRCPHPGQEPGLPPGRRLPSPHPPAADSHPRWLAAPSGALLGAESLAAPPGTPKEQERRAGLRDSGRPPSTRPRQSGRVRRRRFGTPALALPPKPDDAGGFVRRAILSSDAPGTSCGTNRSAAFFQRRSDLGG